MIFILIVAGDEAAARALLAGVYGASGQTTSSGRLQIGFTVDGSGQLTSGGAALYASLVSAGYVDFPVADCAPIYELSTTAQDGSTVRTFYFPHRVGRIVVAYVGGVAQFPADVSVTGDGGILCGPNMPAPAGPVSALFVAGA